MITNTDEEAEGKLSWLSSWPALIIFCLVLPMMFRGLLYAPFHIPSGSMKPTLLIGDFLFVSKATYGYSKYSFPFGMNLLDTRATSPNPQRGDVVVFRPPPTPQIDFIKRVIGLPGDRIQVVNGMLYINDKKIARKQIEDFTEEDKGTSYPIKHYIETLPNGVSYSILDEKLNGRLDNTRVFTVPAGHYFLMGDNRDNSADSRTKTVGFVPKKNLVGRAEVVFLSSKTPLWHIHKWFDNFRKNRFFKDI